MAGLLLAAGCASKAPTRTSVAAPTATPTVPTRTQPPPAPTQTSGVSHVTLPATFRMRSGGALRPPTISAPASVPVVLTIISGDTRGHQVSVKTGSKPVELRVPPRGRASARLPSLARGAYVILVDGVARGHLVIGAQPGP